MYDVTAWMCELLRRVLARFGAEMNKSSVPGSASTVFGDQLEPFTSPRHALDEAYRKLGSDDWSVRGPPVTPYLTPPARVAAIARKL